MDEEGTAWSWGNNDFGQLGQVRNSLVLGKQLLLSARTGKEQLGLGKMNSFCQIRHISNSIDTLNLIMITLPLKSW